MHQYINNDMVYKMTLTSFTQKYPFCHHFTLMSFCTFFSYKKTFFYGTLKKTFCCHVYLFIFSPYNESQQGLMFGPQCSLKHLLWNSVGGFHDSTGRVNPAHVSNITSLEPSSNTSLRYSATLLLSLRSPVMPPFMKED